MLSLLEKRARGEKGISNSRSLVQVVQVPKLPFFFFMTHTVILFRGEKKAFWTHYSSHCGCALIWNKVERWGVGVGGQERYSAKAQLQTSLLCWMKAELQLAGAFRVLFMGLHWRMVYGVAKAICATLRTIMAFSPKMLFGMGDWGNNYTGESLKPEALQCRRSARHNTRQWGWGGDGGEREHNLHKPANLSFDKSMVAVYSCYRAIVCSLCSGFAFCWSAAWQPSVKLRYWSQQFGVCITLTGAKQAQCSDSWLRRRGVASDKNPALIQKPTASRA